MLEFNVSQLHIIDCALEARTNKLTSELVKCRNNLKDFKKIEDKEKASIILNLIHKINNKLAEIEEIRNELKLTFKPKITVEEQITPTRAPRKRKAKAIETEPVAASA